MNIRKKFSGQFIIISLFLMFLSFSMITGIIFQIIKIKEYKAEMTTLKKQLQTTKQEISKLEDGIGPKEDLEDTVRQRLNMVRPDEIIYIDIGKGPNKK